MSAVTPSTIMSSWMSRVWNELDASAIDEMLADDAKVHGLGEPLVGPAGFRAFHEAFSAAFGDFNLTVDGQVVSGEEVAARWSGTMEHRSTGQSVPVSGMAMARVVHGKIVEGWNAADFLPMLTTLKIVPADAVEQALTPRSS